MIRTTSNYWIICILCQSKCKIRVISYCRYLIVLWVAWVGCFDFNRWGGPVQFEVQFAYRYGKGLFIIQAKYSLKHQHLPWLGGRRDFCLSKYSMEGRRQRQRFHWMGELELNLMAETIPQFPSSVCLYFPVSSQSRTLVLLIATRAALVFIFNLGSLLVFA